MKEVLMRTKPKYSFTLVVSDSRVNIQTSFDPPLYLQANRNWQWRIWKRTIHSQIFEVITISSNGVLMVARLGQFSTTGCYELKAMNAEIIRIRGNIDITIFPNVNTLLQPQSIYIAKCKVGFDVPNSLASVLGFKQSTVYGVGRHASENLVNIMSVNLILVHRNIIHSSYMRGTQAPVAYNFFPSAAPRQ